MKKTSLLVIALAATAAAISYGQPTQNSTASRPGPRGLPGPHRPPPRLVLALDTNHDGVISADEIANAGTSLLSLDKNGDGKLSSDEIRPPRPADAPPPPPDAVGHPRAHEPLMLALDANSDGELSATEIANAPTSLKALDANHDGQLTRDELRPLPPEGAPADCPPPGE